MPEIVIELTKIISLPELATLIAGVILLATWLYRTSLGSKALTESPQRINKIPPYLPFVLIILWPVVVSCAIYAAGELFEQLPQWQKVLIDNVIFSFFALVGMAAIVIIVRRHFAQLLKGFGLDSKTIPKDFGYALLYFISICPIVAAMIAVTFFLGEIIIGPEFSIQKHEGLESILAHPQLAVRLTIIVTTIVIVPVFEEMLFRGLLQSTLRNTLLGPWGSIAISSIFFSMVHANLEHWLALFALSMCIGYAYEKSGSLFRSIFVHSLFNGLSIVATLTTNG